MPSIGLVAFGAPVSPLPECVWATPPSWGTFTTFGKMRIAFLQALRCYPNARFIGRFDDETYVYTRELVSRINAHLKKTPDAKYFGYAMQNEDLVYASGGAGYVLTRDAATLLEACTSPTHSEWEEFAVGYCMRQNGVQLTDVEGFHPGQPFEMINFDLHGHPSDRVRKKEPLEGYMFPITYHHVSPHSMLAMHDDIYLYEMPTDRRSRRLPTLIHQVWVGDNRPEVLMTSCRDTHQSWTYMFWDNASIARALPNGRLVNDMYHKGDPNLLSVIGRYELLALYGGIVVDSN